MINQKARQQATSSVDKDFYKLLNDRNFGIYYRNNIDKCIIEPLYDDIDQISCIEKFADISEERYKDSKDPELLREAITQKYQKKLNLNK